MKQEPQSIVRFVYLYTIAFIGLVLAVVGVKDIVDFLLEMLLPDQSAAAPPYRYFGSLRGGVAYVVVGLPLWWYHWRLIRRDRTGQKDTLPAPASKEEHSRTND